MRKSEMRDMTKGNVFNIILGFAIPLLLGMLFQQFYSMVDTIIVGKYLGVSALASVGSTGSINFMIIGFCMGVCNGLPYRWHKNLEQEILKNYVSTSLIVVF